MCTGDDEVRRQGEGASWLLGRQSDKEAKLQQGKTNGDRMAREGGGFAWTRVVWRSGGDEGSGCWL